MPIWFAEVTRNSDGKLVYGNSGSDEFKTMFETDMAAYDDASHTKVLELRQTKEELKEIEKAKVKDANLSTKDRLDALIKYLGIEDL